MFIRTNKPIDVVVAYSEPEAKFAAILVCNFNEATKILRKEVATCPVAAVRAIVYGLHVDTGLLLSMFNLASLQVRALTQNSQV